MEENDAILLMMMEGEEAIQHSGARFLGYVVR